MRVRLGVAVVAVLLSAGLASCDSEEDPGPQTVGPSTSSSAPESSVSESPDPSSSAAPSTAPKPEQTFPPEQQPIVDVYWGFYDTLYALRPNSDEEVRTALAPFAEGTLVDDIVALFAGYREAGEEPAGLPTYGPISVSIDGTTATVNECRDSSSEQVVDAASGQVKETGSVGLKIEVALQPNANGDWRVRQVTTSENAC